MAKLPTIGPFPFGVNNRKLDHDLVQPLQRGTADLLRSAVNVDLDTSGKPRRRDGYEQVIEGGTSHSVWGDDKIGFYADGQSLYWLALVGDTLTPTEIRDDLTHGLPLSYCEAAGTYFYTNDEVLGMARDGARVDFTPPLYFTPALTAIAGALSAGSYQFCLSQRGPAGESETTVPQVIQIPDGGGIRIGSIPTPAPGTALTAYMTGADGEVFGRIDLQVSDGVADIVSMPVMGARPQTLLLQQMPAGSIVRHSNGRLLVARGNVLFYSEPFMNALYRPSKNYIPFAAPISVVEPCGSGVFVVADKTYWFEGDLAQAAMLEKLPYGAVPHSGGTDPTDSSVVFWISDRGLVFGGADGSVKNLQEEQLALAGGQAGATVLREHEGQTHVLTAVRDPLQSKAAVGCFFDAEIIRKGVVL